MLNKPLKIKFKKDKHPYKLLVMPASYEIEQRLKTIYAVTYRKCIKQGVATRPSMIKLMEEEGIWTPEDEHELTRLSTELGILEIALKQAIENGRTEDEQRDLIIRMAGLRSQVYELVSIKALPLEHTAEQIAEDVQLDHYIVLCTINEETNMPYFSNHDEFMRRRGDADVRKIVDAVIDEKHRGGVDMIRDLPEHRWMREHKYMDENGNMLPKGVQSSIEEKIVEESQLQSSTTVDEIVKD